MPRKEEYVSFVYSWKNKMTDLTTIKRGFSVLSKPIRATNKYVTFNFALEMYPDGELGMNSQESNTGSLYIKYIDGPRTKFYGMYKFTFLCSNGTDSCHYVFQDDLAEFWQGCMRGSRMFFDSMLTYQFRQRLQILDVDSFVTVNCTLQIPLRYFSSLPWLPFSPLLFENKRIGVLLDSVLNENVPHTFSDVSLISNDEKVFRCHKVILSTFAPYFFRQLFESNMTETKTDEIFLPFIGGDALAEILRYIYQNHIIMTNLKPFAVEILNAAEMYQLNDLKKYCEICLLDDINDSNVISMAKIGHLFSLNYLKQKAFFRIKERFLAIVESSDWLKLLDENHSLATEIMSQVNNAVDDHIDDFVKVDTVFKLSVRS